jgi:hypothetical protein
MQRDHVTPRIEVASIPDEQRDGFRAWKPAVGAPPEAVLDGGGRSAALSGTHRQNSIIVLLLFIYDLNTKSGF